MNAAPFSIGIIGAGNIAVNAHIPVLRAMADVHIAWLSDTDTARLRAVGRANNLPTRPVEDIARSPMACDAVLLAIPLLPRQYYFELLTDGAAGIFTEKPFALDADGHKRLLARFESWRLGCGYQRRHYATSRMLRRLRQSQAFGLLREVHIHEGGRTTRAGESGYVDDSAARGGGVVKNLGCHSLDLALWITGAKGHELVERRVEWDDGETDRHAAARLRLTRLDGEPGASCTLDWTVSWLEPQANLVELRFETAQLRCPITPADAIEILDKHGRRIGEIPAAEAGGAVTVAQAFYLEWEDFLQGVRNKRESSVSAASCLAVAEIMDELLWGVA